MKCYLLTEDSKTVHFDLDEDGHHEISTKDSQSHEGSVLFIPSLIKCMYNTIEHVECTIMFSVHQPVEITFYCVFLNIDSDIRRLVFCFTVGTYYT